MGKGGGTIGYHYLGTMLFGIGRGPVNELVAIKVGGELVWEGRACGMSPHSINKPDIFGGEKKEGGIQGVFGNFMGAADQVLPGPLGPLNVGQTGPYQSGTLPDLKAALATEEEPDVSEFRGRHIFWYDGLLSSMNPYIKTWEFRRRRTTAGWHNDECWYPEKATIYLRDGLIYAMNPAHMLYQAFTDPTWGRGLPASDLDDNSFTYAANLFCSEMFGLCMRWERRDEIGNFIESVLDHSGAVVYTDRETGKINLKPLRDDYDPNDLPHFDQTNGLLSLYEDDSASSDNIADEVIVTGLDPITNLKIEGRSYNLAVRRFLKGTSTSAVEYPGLPTLELCNRVAERNRNLGGAGLRKFAIKMDRNGFRLHPGAVIKITYLPRGIQNLVLRVGDVDDGEMANGTITVRAVQDVFGLPLVGFVKPVENTYVPPTGIVEPAVAVAYEATYRDLYLNEQDNPEEGESYLAVTAAAPNLTTIEYDLNSRAQGETDWITSSAQFTATAVLGSDVTAVGTTLSLVGAQEFPDDVIGMALRCGEEFMRIDAYNATTGETTVTRGCVDTWPQVHAAEDRVWLVDDDIGSDFRAYVEGETVESRVLPRTSTAVLNPTLATILTTDMHGRGFRPYPPADVRVDGDSIYAGGAATEGPVTWVERNRLTQADQLVGFFETTVTAEAATTYEIDILEDDGSTVINTYTAVSPWTYDNTMQTADGTSGSAVIPAKIYAVRDGVRSREQAWFMIRGGGCGYGFNYGNDYGGGC